MHSGPQLNVVVMHSRPLLSIGVQTALRGEGHFSVRGQDAQGAGIAEDVDVVVADYGTAMRLMGESTERCLHRRARVMILTTRRRASDIEYAMKTGVHAYLLSGCEVRELIHGVEVVAQGSRYLCAASAQFVAEGMSQEPFTERQKEVLDLLIGGLSNKLIARSLGVTEGTVKSHVKAVLSKLGAQSRTEAMSIAMRRGIVTAASAD